MGTYIKEIGKVYETNDTSKFKIKIGNRDVNHKHVERLVEAIKDNDLRIPIEVDKDYNIMDGQHRFFAYKKLGKPFVFYVNNEVNEITDIQEMNNISIKWKLEDYVDSFIKLGNPHYISLKEFCEKYNISLSVSMVVFGFESKSIKEGRFKITNLPDNVKIAENLHLIRKNWSKDQGDRFDFGVVKFLKTYPKADIPYLISKLIKYPSKTFVCTKRVEYVNMFVELYNYNLTKSKRL